MRPLLFALLSLTVWPAALRADDLFREDGKVVTLRTLTLRGKTYESIQLGRRTPQGIEVYHRRGMMLCAEADLPALWVKALAKHEATKLTPPEDPKKPKPATTQEAEEQNAYREEMAKGIMSATFHLLKPVPLKVTKADGQPFTGELVAMKPKELLITDGKNVVWVPDSYFAKDQTVRGLVTWDNCPQVHLLEREAAEKAAQAKAATNWPDKPDVQKAEVAKRMREWDKQHPAPVRAAGGRPGAKVPGLK